jgi:exopolysaccharide biosynthesis polyprenyl glycosylphosphotransferase
MTQLRNLQRDIRFTNIYIPLDINWRSLGLMGGDLLALAIAWKIALALNDAFSPLPAQLNWGEFAGLPTLFWLFAGAMVLVFAGQNFYRSEQERSYVAQAQCLCNFYLFSLVVSYFYDPKVDAPRSLFIPAWLGSVFLVIALRLLLSLVFDQLHLGERLIPTFLIAPEGRQAELRRIIETRTGCRMVGCLPAAIAHQPDCLATILSSGAQQVIAEGLPETELASHLYWQLRSAGITLRLLPSSLMLLHRRGKAEIFAGMPTICISPELFGAWEYLAKRLLDIMASLVGLVLLSPLFLLIGIAIELTSKGGAFYSQERVGLHGQVFRMWKFRSMYQHADQVAPPMETNGKPSLYKIVNDPRVTKLGKFLRRTSLDELPQLFNVLLGQMSLVGPRPLPLGDVAKFSPWHHSRHLVMPGITGLWQVSGRSDLSSIDEVVQLDLFYIDHWSLNLDLQLILETLRIVIFGKGAY